MAQSDAQSVEEYLNELPPDRREAIAEVRGIILENLPEGYEEAMEFGMIGYVIPLETYPNTYNKHPLSYAALASQKNYMSLYLMNIYGDEGAKQWFTDQVQARGIKLNMGKSCIRFKRLNDLPLDLVGEAIAYTPVSDYIKFYEAARRGRK